MYADKITDSMAKMMSETSRRRVKQIAFNTEHNITPTTIYKTYDEVMASTAVADVKSSRDIRREKETMPVVADSIVRYLSADQKADLIEEMKAEMARASQDLEFERAAQLRDEIRRLNERKDK
jgi:excinuclease ABC subunit B